MASSATTAISLGDGLLFVAAAITGALRWNVLQAIGFAIGLVPAERAAAQDRPPAVDLDDAELFGARLLAEPPDDLELVLLHRLLLSLMTSVRRAPRAGRGPRRSNCCASFP